MPASAAALERAAPVEQLWGRVDQGELSAEQACVLATHAMAQRTTRAAFPAPRDWAAFSLLGAWS